MLLTTFAGRVGDHNDRAMAGARLLGRRLADRWSLEQRLVGTPQPALSLGWREELDAAQVALRELSSAVASAGRHGRWLSVLPRCTGALATLPVVAATYPEVCVVWFDAHADLHTPTTTTSGYLGGMALSAPLGWWDSGHGNGLGAAVLVGARDIDPAEQQLLAERQVPVLDRGDDLVASVAGRPVYVHLDCDVLEPGIVPTDYRVPGGLDLAGLAAACRALTDLDVVGLEIAELEDTPADEPAPALDPLLDALAPLVAALAGEQQPRASG